MIDEYRKERIAKALTLLEEKYDPGELFRMASDMSDDEWEATVNEVIDFLEVPDDYKRLRARIRSEMKHYDRIVRKP